MSSIGNVRTDAGRGQQTRTFRRRRSAGTVPDGLLQMTVFNPVDATDQEIEAYHRLVNRIRRERWPEDRPKDLEETTARLRKMPAFMEPQFWAVWQANGVELAGVGEFYTYDFEDNQHVADFYIAVVPEMRRQGIARGLLRAIVAEAQARRRSLLITELDSNMPSGEEFMQRVGGGAGLTLRVSQLQVASLDRGLLRVWQERAQERARDFELGVWEGAYPDDQLDDIVALLAVMNTAPHEDLDVEDWVWTPGQIRQNEASLAARGVERWTLYAQHRESGELAGYTIVLWNPREPELLLQADTGVFPRFRNRGLGRWIKAAMLDRVLRERPSVRRVRTGNAQSNGAMLRINEELGFNPYKTETIWQVGVEQALAYLGPLST